MKNLLLLFITFLSFANTFGQTTLKINVTGLRSSKGNIRLAFYNNSESFDKEKALFIRIVPKEKITKGTFTITYTDLKSGTYGIAILDDENANNKMDYGLMLPDEGFGFSNYYHTSMSRPKFEKFSFKLNNEPKTVEIKVRYM